MKENLIYDIGLHLGSDTDFYLKKGFDVVAVEAHPDLVSKARERFSEEIRQGRLTIINKAISEEKRHCDFYVFDYKDDWGSIYAGWNTKLDHRVKKISVETITLDEIIREHGIPYYMKIDIEGADILCLKSLLCVDEKPKYVSTELLAPYNVGREEVQCMDVLSHLRALGYDRFLVSDQSKNEQVKAPSPPLEGEFVDYRFDGTSSGLFGKELRGEWCTLDELSIEYLDFFYNMVFHTDVPKPFFERVRRKLLQRRNRFFHPAGWFDVHATRGE